MPLMTSQILKSMDFRKKHKNLDISRTKKSLIGHQGLLCGKEQFCSGGKF